MTKLNITNKTIYKLKKNKNQSKKNVPKKRKYKKRKHKNGRSFRKRRRKYNIKNNSIKKYKKQKGGVIKVDTAKSIKTSKEKTMDIIKREKELVKLKEQQEQERKLLKQEKQENLEFKATKERGVDTKPHQEKILKLGYKKENEEKKIKKLDTYKEHVDAKLKEYKDNLKNLKKIKKDKDNIEKANNRIKSKNAEIGKKNAEIELAKNALTTADEEEKKRIQQKIKEGTDKVKLLNAEIKVDATMIKQVMKKVIDDLKTYFNNPNEFNVSRPQTDELVISAEVWEIIQNGEEVKEKEEEYLKNKIVEFNIREQGEGEELKKYYDIVKVKNIDSIVKLLTDEIRWISGEKKKITGRIKKDDNDLKKANEALINVKEKNEEEIKTKFSETFKKQQENDEKVNRITLAESVKKDEEKRWRKTQEEASETIKDGETGFEKKIKSMENRNIETIKQEIETTQKALNELGKKPTDKKKELKQKLENLNAEYDKLYKDFGMEQVKKPQGYYKKKKLKDYKTNVEIKEKEIEKQRRIKKNWAKAGLVASKVLHAEFKLPMLSPYISDDMVEDPDTLKEDEKENLMKKTENYRLLHKTPYISSDGDDEYARADKPTKPKFGKPFYNYYLNKTIKTPASSSRMDLYKDAGELKIFEMIEQRKARFIKWLMRKKNGKADIEELTKQIKKFEEGSSGLMRNTLEEKIITLTFLAYLISRTDEVYIPPLPENPSEEQKKELKASKFERAIKDLHKTTIDGDSLFKLFCIYVPGYVGNITLTRAIIDGFNPTNFSNNITVRADEEIDSGLKRFNDYKPNHSDCGVLDENDENVNYLSIGLSNFSGVENLKKWIDTKEAEEEEKRKKTKNDFDEAQTDMNNANMDKDKQLKALSDKIKNRIDGLKIEQTDAEIAELEKKIQAMRTDVTERRMLLDEGHAKKLEEQKQKYEEEAKKAGDALAVKEGLLEAQKNDIIKNQEKIEKLETDLEIQNQGIKTCNEGDAELKAQYETKKAELEAEINLMKDDKKDMEAKMNDLETEKENAVKAQEEYREKMKEAEDKKVALEKDIAAAKSPTKVSEKTLIDEAENDEENPVDAAFDAMEDDGGLNIDIDEKEPLMIFLTQKDGELEVVTSKLPGNDISSWLMGAGAD